MNLNIRHTILIMLKYMVFVLVRNPNTHISNIPPHSVQEFLFANLSIIIIWSSISCIYVTIPIKILYINDIIPNIILVLLIIW